MCVGKEVFGGIFAYLRIWGTKPVCLLANPSQEVFITSGFEDFGNTIERIGGSIFIFFVAGLSPLVEKGGGKVHIGCNRLYANVFHGFLKNFV